MKAQARCQTESGDYDGPHERQEGHDERADDVADHVKTKGLVLVVRGIGRPKCHPGRVDIRAADHQQVPKKHERK